MKICGLGEPSWLAASTAATSEKRVEEYTPGHDLAALGQVANEWAAVPAKRKGAKTKQLAEPLREILERLAADDPAHRYTSAVALLEELDRAGDDVPANPEAWDRLLRHVRDHGQEAETLRKSA